MVKRGSMPRLHCRVKHDPTLKLTVTWLKDDAPLYIGNRSVGDALVGFLSQDGRDFYRTVSGVDIFRVPVKAISAVLDRFSVTSSFQQAPPSK